MGRNECCEVILIYKGRTPESIYLELEPKSYQCVNKVTLQKNLLHKILVAMFQILCGNRGDFKAKLTWPFICEHNADPANIL